MNDWTFFDKIYCISVANRSDRREMAMAQFVKAGLGGLVEFVLVEKHPVNSQQGIFESHQKCLRMALEHGADNVLIFEDDVLFDPVPPAAFANAVRFLGQEPDWHLFFLGCFLDASSRTRFPSVVRIRYRCALHAYAVRASLARKLVGMPWEGVAFDDLLRRLNDQEVYAMHPAICFQSDSPTDNHSLPLIPRLRAFMGGLRVLQKWNQFVCYNVRPLVAVHLIAVAAFVYLKFFQQS